MIKAIQYYLTDHSFEQLKEDHGVECSFSKNRKKVSLNYSQIESDSKDTLANQCRGIILAKQDGSAFGNETDIVGLTTIVAYPFDRFFNYGDVAAAPIDWSSVKFPKKLDGTLCILYHDKNDWCVATRSVPEADIPLTGGMFTFRSLFEKAVKDFYNLSFKEFTNKFSKMYCYMFELETPYNIVTIVHKTSKLSLLGARENFGNYNECSTHWVEQFAVKENLATPILYNLSSVDEMIEFVAQMNKNGMIENEGLVLVDKHMNRQKVKNLDYVLASKIRTNVGASDRNILTAILNEKWDDTIILLAGMDEIIQRGNDLAEDLRNFIYNQEKTYHYLFENYGASRKKFAIASQNPNNEAYMPYMMARYTGKVSSFLDYIAKQKKENEFPTSFIDSLLKEIDK
jgi:hypothetical protein